MLVLLQVYEVSLLVCLMLLLLLILCVVIKSRPWLGWVLERVLIWVTAVIMIVWRHFCKCSLFSLCFQENIKKREKKKEREKEKNKSWSWEIKRFSLLLPPLLILVQPRTRKKKANLQYISQKVPEATPALGSICCNYRLHSCTVRNRRIGIISTCLYSGTIDEMLLCVKKVLGSKCFRSFNRLHER